MQEPLKRAKDLVIERRLRDLWNTSNPDVERFDLFKFRCSGRRYDVDQAGSESTIGNNSDSRPDRSVVQPELLVQNIIVSPEIEEVCSGFDGGFCQQDVVKERRSADRAVVLRHQSYGAVE